MLKRITIKRRVCIGFGFLLLTQSCSTSDSLPAPVEQVKYVTKLFEYQPAPGQLINQSLGDINAAKSILGGNQGAVSLGSFGGYIVLGFDQAVINSPNKNDIAIYGNAMDEFAEPGVVWVMKDENGNGIPDDVWYEIRGSEFGKANYIQDYTITYFKPTHDTSDVLWKDNKGKEGKIRKNSSHNQSYYPNWINQESYTLVGSLLPESNINKSNPQLITSKPFAYGYADNMPGGDEIDIEDAVDKEGQKVSLTAVDFIKIQTGILADLGWLGELSTEITSIEDLNIP